MAGVDNVELDLRVIQGETPAAAPPTYEVATEPPPSYDSIQAKIKQAKEESSGRLEFVTKVCAIFFTTVGFTILLGLSLALPISMIVMGGVHWDDCPAEIGIPVYMVVAGGVGVLSVLYPLIRKFCDDDDDDDDECKMYSAGNVLTTLNVGSFITGSVYVYMAKDKFQSDHPSLDNYCDHTLYYFSFWILTSMYIVLAILFLFLVCFCVYSCVSDSDDD